MVASSGAKIGPWSDRGQDAMSSGNRGGPGTWQVMKIAASMPSRSLRNSANTQQPWTAEGGSRRVSVADRRDRECPAACTAECDSRRARCGRISRGPRVPCGWGCGAELTGCNVRTHFTICAKRPAGSEHVDRRAGNPNAKRGRRGRGCLSGWDCGIRLTASRQS
jgi:hypothetical protein